jgi:hypothetical protein
VKGRRRSQRQLTQAEKRSLALSPGLTVTRYQPGNPGERAEVRQLSPEGPERKRDFVRRLSDESKASEGSAELDGHSVLERPSRP